MNKVYLVSNECRRGILDTRKISRYFELNNWLITQDISNAQVIYLGTCAYSQFKEDEAMAILDRLIKTNPKAEVIVGGCLPGINEMRLSHLGRVKMLTPRNVYDINKIIEPEVIRFEDIPNSNTKLDLKKFAPKIKNFYFKEDFLRRCKRYYFEYGLSSDIYKFTTYFIGILVNIKDSIAGFFYNCGHEIRGNSRRICMIKISDGCRGNCSYCAVKFARGQLRSRSIEEIISKLKAKLSDGYRRFELVAMDSGCYGLDINTNIVALLDEIFKIDGYFNIILDDLNMQGLLGYYDQIFPILRHNQKRIVLKLSIESGSDRIVGLMNRHYNIVEAKRRLLELRQMAPRLRMFATLMVGFPSETDDDFKRTKELLTKIKFDGVVIFKYSKRPNTQASHIQAKVTEKIKTRRMRELELAQLIVFIKNILSLKW